jgi:hypothetical protein
LKFIAGFWGFPRSNLQHGVSSGVGIWLAAKGFGYWSLMAQTLTISATNALFPYWAAKSHTAFTFSGTALRRFLGSAGTFCQ